MNLEIDTVLSSLLANPDRKFMFVEQAFFQRWVEAASPEKFQLMQQVVAAGQMEFVNGGYCMHDESSPTYVDMIDQTTLGHRLIKQQFNVVPSVTWQIDPFGHSSTQASLLSSQLAGFESIFFGRIDYQDRNKRNNNTDLELIWRGSASTGESSQTFAGAMNGYGPPPGLCYDQNGCGSTIPWQDDPSLEEYNVPAYVAYVVQVAQQFAQLYKKEADGTVNIMWTMGSDFQCDTPRVALAHVRERSRFACTHSLSLRQSTHSRFASARAPAEPAHVLPLRQRKRFRFATTALLLRLQTHSSCVLLHAPLALLNRVSVPFFVHLTQVRQCRALVQKFRPDDCLHEREHEHARRQPLLLAPERLHRVQAFVEHFVVCEDGRLLPLL